MLGVRSEWGELGDWYPHDGHTCRHHLEEDRMSRKLPSLGAWKTRRLVNAGHEPRAVPLGAGCCCGRSASLCRVLGQTAELEQ